MTDGLIVACLRFVWDLGHQEVLDEFGEVLSRVFLIVGSEGCLHLIIECAVVSVPEIGVDALVDKASDV